MNIEETLSFFLQKKKFCDNQLDLIYSKPTLIDPSKINRGRKMSEVATSPALLDKLLAAAKRSLTEREIREQKVSFIISSVDDDSTITKAQVERVIRDFEGE
ncbi:hypothetical protein [uncultured Tateyamaria sp.]|uniref:hypothetical protein n=1 Tax=uncultured Tateyamaria sp. TaxID=455651 RepID=UPI0026316B1C|nr:hypothetical protein [uncultured Tateyamaria sp.]